MSEDTARVVGASMPGEIHINGKSCRLHPLSIRDLAEVQREGVRLYRRNYLANLKDSAEFLPNGEDELRKAIEKSAHWDADDLPRKVVFDSSNLQMNEEMKKWLMENLEAPEERFRNLSSYHRMIATCLDSDVLSEEKFQEIMGFPPKKVKTGYINWWVTGTQEGMLSMVWQSVKNYGISREEVDSLISDPVNLMIFAREIESLSVPDVGNG